jgi:uncharacterized membrane protein
MARIEKVVQIDVPVDRVFSFVVTEWQGSMGFFEGIYDCRPVTDEPMGDGFRVAFKVKILGVEEELEMEIGEFVENQGWVARSIRGPETRGIWTFAPTNGGAELTYLLDYKMPLSILGEALDLLFVKGQWETNIAGSLQKLKGILEA